MLPAAGLPAANTFDQWRFGPSLAAAGDRLLLVLFMLHPKQSPIMQDSEKMVRKVAVYQLDMAMAEMRWEEVDNIGAYSLFVDYVGRSSAACVGMERCGMKENRIYIVAPGCRWRAFPPGYEVPHSDNFHKQQFSIRAMHRRTWPTQIWAYPQLFF